jgi:GTP-binding protein
MLDLLADTELPTIVVVTKIDKLSARAAADRIAGLSKELDIDPEQIIPFSAVTGSGRDELAAAVAALVLS